MIVETNYSAAWRDLKTRRLTLLALFLGYVPGVLAIIFAIGLPLSALTGIKLDYFIYPIAFTWMFGFAAAGLRLQMFRCPRCRRRFFATWWYVNTFARKCVHCGLPSNAKSG